MRALSNWANSRLGHRMGRRGFLRGTGVCLALPWLEALSPNPVRGQTVAPVRFVPVFFPNGAAADFWTPNGTGVGDDWALSPILQPFAPLKHKLIVVSNLENYSCMNTNEAVEPSHARCSGAFLTCADSDSIRQSLGTDVANGVSFDQVLAAGLPRETTFESLQTGLSTVESFCDGRHCSLSQSVSWKSPTEPLYKEVNPQALFDTLMGSLAASEGDDAAATEAERRRLLDQSVLDAVLENATHTRARLGNEDQQRLDQFLDSVREVELQVGSMGTAMAKAACEPATRPGLAASYGLANDQDGYNRGDHARIMNELIVLALQCDATRVVSHMLDDARSDFVYDHLENREFSQNGSEPGNGRVGGFHGLQHAGDSNNGYATINWWLAQQTLELCQMMDAIEEGERTLLDNSVVLFGSGMHGSDHDANELPIALLGSGAGRLQTDQHIQFGVMPDERPLRDLYFTLANEVYGLDLDSFGESVTGANHQLMRELLA